MICNDPIYVCVRVKSVDKHTNSSGFLRMVMDAVSLYDSVS